ncbi:MAG TPA: hypothetical protein ENK18_26865 [Deltaproteobacteria bacterium]|nr:hypothetical protein [Deltaproteobacteria bacterium]
MRCPGPGAPGHSSWASRPRRLRGARLRGARLRGARLRGARLRCDLISVQGGRSPRRRQSWTEPLATAAGRRGRRPPGRPTG